MARIKGRLKRIRQSHGAESHSLSNQENINPVFYSRRFTAFVHQSISMNFFCQLLGQRIAWNTNRRNLCKRQEVWSSNVFKWSHDRVACPHIQVKGFKVSSIQERLHRETRRVDRTSLSHLKLKRISQILQGCLSDGLMHSFGSEWNRGEQI